VGLDPARGLDVNVFCSFLKLVRKIRKSDH